MLTQTKTIYFWSRGEEQYQFLSHFYPCRIVALGREWPSAEHYYQAMKFPESLWDSLCRLPDAKAMKLFAREHRDETRPEWDWHPEAKNRVMWESLCLKFTQNPELKAKLVATGEAQLVHWAPWDSYWGNGKDGKGKNMMGKLLMELRTRLR